MLSSLSRAPESMNIIAEVEERREKEGYCVHCIYPPPPPSEDYYSGHQLRHGYGPWKDRLGEYLVSVMCVKRKRERERKMHEGRNSESPITQRERWDLRTSIHMGRSMAPC